MNWNEKLRRILRGGLYRRIGRVLKEIPIDFGGGCSVLKAVLFAELIVELGLHTTVDIGVYRGRSFFPQALAHHSLRNGIVYGIDPFSKQAALQNDTPELLKQLDRFLQNTDFDDLFDSVNAKIDRLCLRENATILRTTSSEAAKEFHASSREFDFIHIDGNHDIDAVVNDLKLFMPLLSKRGVLVMDDVSWRAIRPAVELAQSHLQLWLQLTDDLNDFAVFAHKEHPKASVLRRVCSHVLRLTH
jgi:hypothetical protein